jgi:hypothetical protein
MENTYTYTARSASDPEKVVTFTLRGRRMSVESGVPVEQAARLIESATAEEGEEIEGEEQPASEQKPKLWLKPMAISLVEQGTRPLRVIDVDARATGAGYLWVRGWIRLGGLRLAPITLLDGAVDNSDAALAFVEELARRKDKYGQGPAFLNVLDYWATWLVLGSVAIAFFSQWRKRLDEAEA